MVFNLGQGFNVIGLVVLFFWLTILSFFVYRISRHYNHLIKGASKEDLKTVLEKILRQGDLSQEKIEKLTKDYQKLEAEDRFHIKKIGILRFNPFKDTGGNQSFVLSLLNEENSGLVLSSLYTRTGSRWYVKRIEKGKGFELELSKEEQEALKIAKA